MFGRRKIEYKTDEQLRGMVRAGVVTSRALDAAVAAARPGATTADVDAAFREVLAANGATSNFLGYFGYPATVCVSVNEEVVHGIPGERVLETGDILSIDGGAIVDGWNGDSARTVILGNPSEEDQLLSDVTREAMWRGIAAAATGTRVGDIGAAIEDHVRERVGQRLGILEDYVGHGIGSQMHMAPDVLNYRASGGSPALKPGMCLAIEPMLVTGGIATSTLSDDWTVVTDDGGRASQWEHSVAIHRGGLWVLTAEDGGASELEPLGVTPVPIPGS
ncbi:type I methionyl aminopeptidase [Kocuria palustris]|jgi:methionyl aminopeptidase|uniref:Methionine aminopeptidase n=1 Tax=Kocuria palustris PEL TaxID=1236550 RepID=M2YGT6_9MICC|nr:MULTISPECIES: type I methionyl aminopeptidase [Kocuria]MDN5573370.1 type I methionyl aminopeptidase [Micrococcales bacterium]ALB03692.1 methionine aminopeptidase [Kocuria palustris]EME37729.1 Methionine aminopeptidase [Kocuria palustris PEL]MBM7822492.1 methionyl aminopeptidase [Kocuria palustris]MBN6752820.1 type I methionyl aminopeptidase [Kocuria palustris]